MLVGLVTGNLTGLQCTPASRFLNSQTTALYGYVRCRTLNQPLLPRAWVAASWGVGAELWNSRGGTAGTATPLRRQLPLRGIKEALGCPQY